MAPRRFEQAVTLLVDRLAQEGWPRSVYWPARSDLRIRGRHVILRKPVDPAGLAEHRARYSHGITARNRIVLAIIGRTLGAAFAVVDVQPHQEPGAPAEVVVEFWDFPLRLLTARHRTVWWRLRDAAEHAGMERVMGQ